MKARMIVILATSVLVFGGGVYGQSNWQSVDVAASGKNEWEPDVAVEAGGTAHIVFVKETVKIKKSFGRDIFYSNTDGNAISSPLQLTNLGSTSIGNPGVILDANDNVHVAFEKSSSIGYLNNVGGAFSAVIDISSNSPSGLDMDIDLNGKAHLVFYSLVSGVWHIYYATNTTGSFVVTDLGGFGFDKGALFPTVDEKNGVVHIAFKGAFTSGSESFYQNIYYINNSGGGFPTTNPTLVADTGPHDQDPTISVDSQGTIHIIFDISDVLGIRHAHNSSGSFVVEPVVGAGFFGNAHALGPDDEVGIALSTEQPFGLVFMTDKTGVWTSEAITPAGSGDLVAGDHHGFGFDGSGYVHVVGTIRRGGGNNTNIDVRYHTNNPDFGQPPNAGTECFIQDIAMSLSYKGNGKPSNRGWTATATVLIHDDQGNPVSNATVSGDWSGLTDDSDTGVTGSDGTVSLNSDRINATGTFTFTVTGVSHSNLTYNPTSNIETEDSISNSSKQAPEERVTTTSIPSEFQLFQNHPNPFNPETVIRFALPQAGYVEIKIYNTRGQVIRRLVSQSFTTGEHAVRWDSKDFGGNSVSSGVYLYEIVAGDPSTSSGQRFRQVKKMSLLR